MNNKLFSRIVAASLSALMLGTVSFAATTDVPLGDTIATIGNDLSASAATMKLALINPGDQITIMAYEVDTTVGEGAEAAEVGIGDGKVWVDYSDQKIIALDQIAADSTFNLPINAVTEGKAIAIVMGCSNGDVIHAFVALEAGGEIITFTYGDATEDGKITTADITAIKVYLKQGSHPKYTKIGTSATDGYVYGDATEDSKVTTADVTAIKVYLKQGSHPKYTNIGETDDIVIK